MRTKLDKACILFNVLEKRKKLKMKSRIVANASWIIVCRIIQSILSLVVSMLTARYLGPSNFGLINYAASIVSFIAPVMYLGLSSILVQEIINHPDDEGETLGTSLFMSFIMSILCIIGIICFVSVVNAGERETLIVCSLYSLMLLFQCIDLLQYWFQAKLKSKYTSIVMLIAYTLVSCYKIFLLAKGKSVYWFALSNTLDYFIIAIALLFIYRRVGSFRLRISTKRVKGLLSRSKYYIISNLMVMVFTQTDKIMLKIMLDDSATGYYAAAVGCASLSSFIFSAIIDSMRPSIFESVKYSFDAFEDIVIKLYCIVIYLSLAQSVFLTLLAKPVILILYGEQFLTTAKILRLVVWYTTFSYLGSVRGVWMLATNNQRHLLSINLVGAASNVILNCLLIPLMGVMGAALASLLTQFFTNVVMGYIVNDIRDNNRLMVLGINPVIMKDIIKRIMKN